jgi:hypothetical protein
MTGWRRKSKKSWTPSGKAWPENSTSSLLARGRLSSSTLTFSGQKSRISVSYGVRPSVAAAVEDVSSDRSCLHRKARSGRTCQQPPNRSSQYSSSVQLASSIPPDNFVTTARHPSLPPSLLACSPASSHHARYCRPPGQEGRQGYARIRGFEREGEEGESEGSFGQGV